MPLITGGWNKKGLPLMLSASGTGGRSHQTVWTNLAPLTCGAFVWAPSPLRRMPLSHSAEPAGASAGGDGVRPRNSSIYRN